MKKIKKKLANTIKSGIVMDSLLLTSVKFITMGVGILTTMLLSKKFSLIDYGTYSQSMLIISMGSSLSILGLTDAVNYFYNFTKEQVKRQQYIANIFFIQFIAGILIAIIIIIFNQQITIYFNNPNLIYIYIYISFMPLINNLLSMYQILFISDGKAKIIALRNLIVSILKLFYILIASLITENITTIFIFLLIGDFMQLLYFSYGFRRNSFYIKIKKIDFNLVFRILEYSVPMAFYILLSTLSRNIDSLVIAKFTNTETLAIYTNSAKMLPFDFLTISFATILIPYITNFITEGQNKKGKHLISTYLQLSYLTTWIFALGAIIVAPELVEFLYGEKYLVGTPIFITYVCVSMIRFANVSILLSASGRTKTLMKYSMISLIIDSVLNVVFFFLLGIIGPAISTLLSTLVLNIILLKDSAKILKTTILELLNFKEMLIFISQLISIGVVISGFRLLLKNFDINNFFVLIVVYNTYVFGIVILNYKKIGLLMKELNSIKKS